MMRNGIGNYGRLAVISGIVAPIAVAHIFRLGSSLQGEWYNFYYSYVSDFILPFACYFLLSASDLQVPQKAVPAPLIKTFSLLKRWDVKWAIAFLMPSIAETYQYFGIPVLGTTFDPLDYLAYGVGAMSAVVVDTQIFSRIFDFWTMEKAGSQHQLVVFQSRE